MIRTKRLTVTIKDVAIRAGVSVATVSHVVNQSRFVTEETQKKVKKAVKELNYHPNILAKNLRSKKSNVVGVVICDLENPFFLEVLRGIETSLAEKDYDMLVTNTNYHILKEKKAVEMLYGKQVDGVILVPGSNKGEHVDFLLDLGVPVVVLDKEIEIRKQEVDFVLIDNRKGSNEMIRHLVNLGHERIGIIAGPQDTSTGKERLEGCLQAFEELSYPIREEYIKIGDFKKLSGEKLTLELLSLKPPPSVIYACNNPMGLGSFEVLKKEGIDIPAEVGLVLFDDLPWFPYINPPLTTVSQPPFVMGKIGGDLLLERLIKRRKKPKKVILEVEIKIRFSGGEKIFKR